MSDGPAIHASCVAIGGRAVLIAGPSGSGKSDLALRLIDRGAALVSDDYTRLTRDGDRLLADAPATIAGRIEVRGVGIVALPCVAAVPVALFVAADDFPPRLPDADTIAFHGVAVPRVCLSLKEASAPCKIELLLRRIAP